MHIVRARRLAATLATLWAGTVLLFAPHVSAAASPPIRLHPDNPHVFDFRGKPTVLVTSGEHYGAVLNPDFDFIRYLDTLAADGLNYTRIFTGSYVELPGAFGIEKNTLAPLPGRLLAPWARSQQPGYKNGGNKFDLSRWDPAYFERLDRFVAEASKRGIVVEVTLFSSLYGEPGWAASPLNAANNVNGVGTIDDRKKVHTLDNGNLLAAQEAMVKKIVESLVKYDNVTFEIQNEPWADRPAFDGLAGAADAASLAWQRRVAAVITSAEAGRSHRHAIAQNISNRSQRIDNPDPLVSIFNFHYVSPPDARSQNPHIARVFGFDESGFEGKADATYRREGWHFVLSGGGLFNSLDYSFTIDREDGTATQTAPGGGSPALRKQLGVLSRFVHGFGDALLAMKPGEGFIKGGAPAKVRALSAPGRAYAVYLESDPGGDLVLDLPFAAYEVEWIDARDGRQLARETVTHAGGTRALKTPRFAEDAAVRIVRAPVVVATAALPAKVAPQVSSPDGKLRVTVLHTDMAGQSGYEPGRRLYYQVERVADGKNGPRKVVVDWSPLGLSRADADFVNGLTLQGSATRTVQDRYTLKTGKQRVVAAKGRALTVDLRGGSGERLALDVRAYDDGVAFRYRFPDKRPGHFEVVSEATGFRLPTSGRAYISEHDTPDKWKPAYENVYRHGIPVGTASASSGGWSFPALFQDGEVWTLLTEAGLDSSYFGGRLAGIAPDGLYRVRLPDHLEGEGDGAVTARSTLPWTMPWRVLIIGDGLAKVVESSLVTTLAPPSKVKNVDWVKPGRASWSWWSDGDSPKVYDSLVKFVDFAAEMGWEYSLVDANWDLMKGGDWKQLAAYAHGKNVRIWLWYNSGGRNNTVTERPRDRMSERQKRRAEMKEIAAAGVAGIKVDFFQSDKQNRMQQYIELLEDAAEAKLLVNFHGCTLPRGWRRTYPHLVGLEAVRGAEAYRFNRRFPADAPSHNVTLVFIRNVVGPMDYTPVTFSNSKYPHTTTYAHELALSVAFEVGVLHLADSVEAYRALPEEPKAFLKAVPTVWDETRLVGGMPGALAVIARRNGRGWWVAGINGEAQAKTVKVPLAFLDGGKGKATARHDVSVITDGADDRSFSARREVHAAADTLAIPVRGNGGFVLQITPAP